MEGQETCIQNESAQVSDRNEKMEGHPRHISAERGREEDNIIEMVCLVDLLLESEK